MIRIGIDIGGTGIQVGAVNENLEIISRGSIPTRTDISFEAQVHRIAQCVLDMLRPDGQPRLKEEDIASVGIGIPGIADRKGNIIKCINMGWYHMPFREEFVKYMDKPVLIDNDANVAALAESVAGISAGTSSSVFITLGIVIGSGIILNGRIWNGAHGIGGELGHSIMELDGVPCTCGNHGCLERYCSATAIIRMTREIIDHHPESAIMEACGGNPQRINARIVIDAAREGDPVAVKIYRRYVRYLAQAIASVVNILDPEVIVLGGGVSKAGDFLLNAVREEFPRYVLFNDQPLPRVELAILGPDAGIIGAAMLS